MKVKALRTVVENGVHKKGEVFEINPKRAKALASLVEVVKEVEDKKSDEVVENKKDVKDYTKRVINSEAKK